MFQRTLFATLVLCGITWSANSAGPVASLIERLGSPDYRERQAAFRELDALGTSALDVLRSAEASADSEISHRAVELIRRIEQRIAAERVLQPKLVEIDFQNKPLRDAVRDLAAKTGLTIELANNSNRMKEGTITYRSGKVPVWEAVMGFCRAGGLMEWDGVTPIAGLPKPQDFQNDQAGQVVQFQGGIMIRQTGRYPLSNPGAKQIYLYDGLERGGASPPTHHSGSIRVRLLPRGTPMPGVAPGGDVIPLQVTAEPKIAWQGMPTLKFAQAVDEQGRRLSATVVGAAPMPLSDEEFIVNNVMIMQGYASMPLPQRSQFVGLRFANREQPMGQLKELHGTLSLPVRVTGEVISLERPAKGVAARSNYGTLGIVDYSLNVDGSVTIAFTMELSAEVQLSMPNQVGDIPVIPNARRVLRGGGIVQEFNGTDQKLDAAQHSEFWGLSLCDEHGKPYGISGVTQTSLTADSFAGTKGRLSLTFRPPVGAGPPARVICRANYPVSIETTFRFSDLTH